jgi:hypothetical protein
VTAKEWVTQLDRDLQYYAELISLPTMSRNSGTTFLSRFIREWSREHGLRCEGEVDIEVDLDGWLNPRKGRLDFVIDDYIAIEIDTSNKQWSLKKLEYSLDLGYFPVWIRWSYWGELFNMPPGIHLIVLPELKDRARRDLAAGRELD